MITLENKEIQKQGDQLVKSLEGVFKQAPHLPANIREILVNIAPWIALIFGILGIIAGLGLVGVSPLALFGGVRASVTVLASGVLTLISSVLMLLAYPKLRKRDYAGWMWLFWSELLSAVAALFSLSVGSVLGVILGFYLLFEMKSYYK